MLGRIWFYDYSYYVQSMEFNYTVPGYNTSYLPTQDGLMHTLIQRHDYEKVSVD